MTFTVTTADNSTASTTPVLHAMHLLSPISEANTGDSGNQPSSLQLGVQHGTFPLMYQNGAGPLGHLGLVTGAIFKEWQPGAPVKWGAVNDGEGENPTDAARPSSIAHAWSRMNQLLDQHLNAAGGEVGDLNLESGQPTGPFLPIGDGAAPIGIQPLNKHRPLMHVN